MSNCPPYKASTLTLQVCKDNNLPEQQPMLLIIDCWSVHKSKEFREWMDDVFPYFKLSCLSQLAALGRPNLLTSSSNGR
jgi:hypothetical protein